MMITQFHARRRVETPLPALAATMAKFDRATLEGFVEVAIAVLDCTDGDPDVEANGDEQDHNFSEECFVRHRSNFNPGCPISDPGGCEHDGREEQEDGN
jgi:hypothetical protein